MTLSFQDIVKYMLLSLCMIGWATSVVAADRPNIVFVYTDDQAPTAIGADNEELKTPNMDRLFLEGARLANSFVTTPVCSPARASSMSSRYGTELGITDWINPRRETELGLDPEIVTWPELLPKRDTQTGWSASGTLARPIASIRPGTVFTTSRVFVAAERA